MGLSIPKNPQAAKLEALKRARAAAQPEDGAIIKYIAPADARERLRIEFDDSGSMGSVQTEEAKKGVVELLRNSAPNQTAVAIHFMNTSSEELAAMQSNLISVADQVQKIPLRSGDTPFFATLKKMQEATPVATRYVLFTDGEPTDAASLLENDRLRNLCANADPLIAVAKEQKAPIDTVYFGSAESTYTQCARDFLKYLSDQTGGYFMVFDPAKMSFAKAFKYLSAGNRLLLASESVRREIESGKRA